MRITETVDGIQIEHHGILWPLTTVEALELLYWLHERRYELSQAEEPRITYQEAQRRHLCPYCSLKGHRHPDGPYDRDFIAMICPKDHRFYIEREAQ